MEHDDQLPKKIQKEVELLYMFAESISPTPFGHPPDANYDHVATFLCDWHKEFHPKERAKFLCSVRTYLMEVFENG